MGHKAQIKKKKKKKKEEQTTSYFKTKYICFEKPLLYSKHINHWTIATRN